MPLKNVELEDSFLGWGLMWEPLLSVGTFAKTCRFDVWRSLFTSKTSANSVLSSCAAGHTVKPLFCHWTEEHEQEPKLDTWGGEKAGARDRPRLAVFPQATIFPHLCCFTSACLHGIHRGSHVQKHNGNNSRGEVTDVQITTRRCWISDVTLSAKLLLLKLKTLLAIQLWVDLWNEACQFVLHNIPESSSLWWISRGWNCSVES